ncbi:Exoglucanase [Tephrocybe rancida]|nr:Exoglucanase [Tephrocybe rancida]
MFPRVALTALSFLAIVSAQQVGTNTPETHPTLPWYKCTKAGGCVSQSAGAVTLDANWRWTHGASGTNCYNGNAWDNAQCPDGVTCAANCALEGASYASTYGITTSGDAVTLKFVTTSGQKNVGSRIYLMASETRYELFKLVNQEFTFDVDVSNLPCGLNGALYFSEMDADGGIAKYPTNKAGAKYGTGYCDAQCPRDLKFIAGESNSVGWTPSTNDVNSGTGNYGACCNEMDIWEANKISAAYTPHPCTTTGLSRCSGASCGSSDRYGTVCDPDGCDFNSFRMGAKSFYGPGLTVDTNKKFTVVTQFVSSDGTASGDLVEIRRLYVQNGVVIQNSKVNIPGMSSKFDSVTNDFCDAQKSAFGDKTQLEAKGGLTKMGQAAKNGMVLVLSVWDDHNVNMLWLDSNYPTTADPATPGVSRGTCATTSGAPSDVETNSPNASVTYSNIRFGDLGSTYTGSPGSVSPASSAPSSSVPATSTRTSTSSAPSNTGTAAKWAQCGGIGYTGPTTCVAGTTCKLSNEYYSQCL